MKSIILTIQLFISLTIFSQVHEPTLTSHVDKRIELLSICFRLADCEEYSSKLYSKYTDRIEAHFSAYKSHPLIPYIQKKLRTRGVGYDAVMLMAISISEPPNISPLRDFDASFPTPSWGKKRATKFLKLLHDFYQKSDAERFFTENQDLYAEASKQFQPVIDRLDLNWYTEFYGCKPTGGFQIVNGLGNGVGNYGPKIYLDSTETIYAIMGTWSVDSLGNPSFQSESYFSTLLHEFNHSFVNHLVEKYTNELRIRGEEIYAAVAEKMRSQAYGEWSVMISESIVRAAVIHYMKVHEFDATVIENETKKQLDRGFFWIEELVQQLEIYDKQREHYPTFESFIPQIVVFMNELQLP